jgi:hypothetical protein
MKKSLDGPQMNTDNIDQQNTADWFVFGLWLIKLRLPLIQV